MEALVEEAKQPGPSKRQPADKLRIILEISNGPEQNPRSRESPLSRRSSKTCFSSSNKLTAASSSCGTKQAMNPSPGFSNHAKTCKNPDARFEVSASSSSVSRTDWGILGNDVWEAVPPKATASICCRSAP